MSLMKNQMPVLIGQIHGDDDNRLELWASVFIHYYWQEINA